MQLNTRFFGNIFFFIPHTPTEFKNGVNVLSSFIIVSFSSISLSATQMTLNPCKVFWDLTNITWLSYGIHFSSYVTIRLSRGHDADKPTGYRRYPASTVCDAPSTHAVSVFNFFFTVSVCYRWSEMVELKTLNVGHISWLWCVNLPSHASVVIHLWPASFTLFVPVTKLFFFNLSIRRILLLHYYMFSFLRLKKISLQELVRRT